MRSAVLFIEMQNEWLRPEGRIHHLMTDTEQFARAATAAERLLLGARARDARIVHAGLGFSPGHAELGVARQGLRAAIKEFGTFPLGDERSQFDPRFSPVADEFVVRGRTGASAFAGSNLDAYLRNNRIEQLFIAGFALHVCVLATAWQAHDLGYDVNVVAEATAAFTREQREVVLDGIVPHLGAAVSVDQALSALVQLPSTAPAGVE